MSAVDSKRSWLALMDETGDNKGSTKDSSMENTNSRKRAKPNSKSESDKSSGPPKKPLQLETDHLVLQRRQKQIDYGKNTVGYHNYVQQVPMDKRAKEHPRTPDKYTKYSRRSWDTLIKMWRIKLHEYDTDEPSHNEDDYEDYLDNDDNKGSTKDSSMENTNSRKRAKPNSKSESDKSSGPSKEPLQLETDHLVLKRRQKQIDYGKNTVGYHNYVQQVPMDKRGKEHPRTPDKYTKYSRRSWDTLIKMWRIKLHEYDTDEPSHNEDDYEDYLDNDGA